MTQLEKLNSEYGLGVYEVARLVATEAVEAGVPLAVAAGKLEEMIASAQALRIEGVAL